MSAIDWRDVARDHLGITDEGIAADPARIEAAVKGSLVYAAANLNRALRELVHAFADTPTARAVKRKVGRP